MSDAPERSKAKILIVEDQNSYFRSIFQAVYLKYLCEYKTGRKTIKGLKMFSVRLPDLRHYLLALLLVGIGLLMRIVLTNLVGPGLPTYITFYPCVMISALVMGLGSGILATLASLIIVDYWLLKPVGSLKVESPVDIAGAVFFFGICVLMSLIASRYRTLRIQLEEKVTQRTAELMKVNEAIKTENTERKRAEELLQKAHDELEIRVLERTADLAETIDRLEKANQELEEFTYIASHDLQEPLRKIQTFSDMAKKRHPPLADKTGQDYLDRILVTAGRMRQLLQELLAISRVTSQKQPFKKTELTKTVQEAADIFVTVLKETGGQVTIETLPTIEADETQMRQLFQNLIGNALKFRDDRIPVIQVIGKVIDKKKFEIVVKDNGIGFDQQFAELIFKPFERLHGRSNYEGTGMGLAICRKIVERHSGTIRAESQPDQGTSFIIRLPLKQTKAEVN
jgi:signal transduction histidine kinase